MILYQPAKTPSLLMRRVKYQFSRLLTHLRGISDQLRYETSV